MSDKDMREVYISWLQRSVSHANDYESLYKHAWEVARKAADLLRKRYGVNRIRVFGSLVHKDNFHPGSDVDLAVEGLKPSDYWKALASVLFIDDKVTVEVIDRAICRPEVWEVVEREGVDL